MSIKDGGPAFPRAGFYAASGYDNDPAAGMSLRDWFAGHALAGLLARDFGSTNEGQLQEIAEKAYDLADAMLTDREALS